MVNLYMVKNLKSKVSTTVEVAGNVMLQIMMNASSVERRAIGLEIAKIATTTVGQQEEKDQALIQGT